MAFEKMKESIPMMVAFVLVTLHLSLTAYFFFGGTLNLQCLNFLGNYNKIWFISLVLCVSIIILLAHS